MNKTEIKIAFLLASVIVGYLAAGIIGIIVRAI